MYRALDLNRRANSVAEDDEVLLGGSCSRVLVHPSDQRAELSLSADMEQIFDVFCYFFSSCGVVEHDDGLGALVMCVRVHKRVGKVAPFVIRADICKVNEGVNGKRHAQAAALPCEA